MNKDAIMASVIGFGIGLLITGTLILGPKLIKNFPQVRFPSFSFAFALPGSNKPETPTQVATELTLDDAAPALITVPVARSVLFEDTITVSGVTTPGDTVVVSGFVDDTIVTADAKGSYAAEIALTEGQNDIVVTAYTEGKPTTQGVTVYYTEETLE